jgi:hypothetical protein
MEVFNDIDTENDWVCCTWRNHYQGLLKGIPKEVIRENIMGGKSMVMNLPEYKFICSSIVGGIPSIAAGIAFALKLQGKTNKVWCWVGDMSAETGAFHEAYKYSLNHELPITFIVIVPPLAEHVEFCLPIDTTEKPASACKYVLPLTEHNAESVTMNAAVPGVNPVNVGLFEYVTNVVPLLPE